MIQSMKATPAKTGGSWDSCHAHDSWGYVPCIPSDNHIHDCHAQVCKGHIPCILQGSHTLHSQWPTCSSFLKTLPDYVELVSVHIYVHSIYCLLFLFHGSCMRRKRLCFTRSWLVRFCLPVYRKQSANCSQWRKQMEMSFTIEAVIYLCKVVVVSVVVILLLLLFYIFYFVLFFYRNLSCI